MTAPAPDTDHADVRILPPLLSLACVVVGLVLQWLVPLRIGGGGARVAFGLVLVAAGLGAGGWAISYLRRTHQDPDPRTPTPELILGGPFQWSRNPIYFGLALLQAGLGVALGNAWLLLMLVPFVWICQRHVIEREEAYLTRKFGDAYTAYQAAVRRWL